MPHNSRARSSRVSDAIGDEPVRQDGTCAAAPLALRTTFARPEVVETVVDDPDAFDAPDSVLYQDHER